MFAKAVELLQKKLSSISLLSAALLALTLLLAGSGSAQAATGTPKLTTNHWRSATGEGYTLTATLDVPGGLGIATVTIAGPHFTGSETDGSQQMAATDGTLTRYITTEPIALNAAPVATDRYTLKAHWVDATAPDDIFVLPVTTVVGFAEPIGPAGAIAGSGSPLFSWNALAVAQERGYRVALSGADIPAYSADVAPNETTHFLPAAPTPTAGILYDWSIFAFDPQGNSSEVRSSFMLGTNFTGKVTDMGGVGVPDVSIIVSAGGVQQPLVATSRADGTYMYGGLATGNYNVTFGTSTFTTFYNNSLTSPGNILPITSGVITPNVDAKLGFGAISGSIFLSGAQQSQAVATLYNASKTAAVSSVPPLIISLIGGFSSFKYNLIPPGTYHLSFGAQGYASAFNLNSPSTDTTGLFTVTAGLVTSSIDVTLFPGASKAGDADGDGAVSIAEVQSAINMFLGLKAMHPSVDQDGNSQVSIAEVQKSINAFLGL